VAGVNVISPETIETIKVLDLIATNKTLTTWTVECRDRGAIKIEQIGGGFSHECSDEVLSGLEILSYLSEYSDIAKKLSKPMMKGKNSSGTFYIDECQT
jgi:hypothetical protein